MNCPDNDFKILSQNLETVSVCMGGVGSVVFGLILERLSGCGFIGHLDLENF